jgi:dipeptidyl aminopeptidase/acylaminoacyl peptidase
VQYFEISVQFSLLSYTQSIIIFMKKTILLSLSLFAGTIGFAQKNSSVKFEQWLSLKYADGPVISHDGKDVAFTITRTDWKDNTYDSEIWLSHEGSIPFQLTQTPKGSSNTAQFSPDGKWLSFLADRGDKTQLYIISPNGGEAMQVTNEEDGINSYEWSPNGKKIAFVKTESDSKIEKGTKEHYGAFDVEDQTFKFSQLWLINFDYDSLRMANEMPCAVHKPDSANKKKETGCANFPKAEKLTNGNYTVRNFTWSPDGGYIGVTVQPDPRIKSGGKSDIVLVELAGKKLTTLISNPGPDIFEKFSPDSKLFIYTSALNDTTSYFYKNNGVFIYDLASRTSKEIGKSFDETKNIIDWNPKGIFFNASQKTRSFLYHLDPANGTIVPVKIDLDVVGGASFSKDGQTIAFGGRRFNGLYEIFLLKPGGKSEQITHMSNQISNWNLPQNEVISWKSNDGATVEGILLKPSNYDPNKKYPLLVVIHGGPAGVDRPEPTPTYVYPIMQWAEKGALVLRVNYRGSTGYGEAFRSLNVRNLGVGDMWDVMSGVKFLTDKGIVDTTRMGCMGWSQGGYISAFLTTNTHNFKAISVGAGISDWATYYVSTDITPFTPQYLKGTPWNDPAIYQLTSPITHINQATTPTLIQHGELDKRVPISDAFELYRALQDRGIPSKLIVYKGFGHGITKPKERLAAIWHNWQWFNYYVFGEPIEEMPVD